MEKWGVRNRYLRNRSYAIIGAGVVGLAIAREILLRDLGSVTVFDKEIKSGAHASGRNSGVIHSGINQKPGTEKARLSLEGSKKLRQYCEEKDIGMEICGTLVTALTENDRMKLYDLKNMGDAAGVPGLRIISPEEMREREPNANGIEALLSPTGAIVDSHALLKTLENEIWLHGGFFEYGMEVTDIHDQTIETNKGFRDADYIINCAGLNADRIAHFCGVGKQFRMLPFRGDYTKVPAQVNSMIYQVPDLRFPFLGVHLTKTIEGDVIAGPTANLSFGGREDYELEKGFSGLKEMAKHQHFWAWTARTLTSPSKIKQIAYNRRIASSSEKFVKEVRKIYNGEIDPTEVNPYRSGIRAQLVDNRGRMVNDFLVLQGVHSTHLLNVVSPGLTSSLALARHVVENYVDPRKRE
jgi:(S)-2-hydroxyglutarate dehydrogenase